MASDAEVFQNMKAAYVQTRGRLSRFWFLVKPVTVEYIQASVDGGEMKPFTFNNKL